MALGHRLRFPFERSTQRYVVATFGLVGVWVLLLAGALMTLLLTQDPASILPPLERLAYTITVLLLSWAFLTADHSQWGNRPNIVLVGTIIVTVIAYIVTAMQWRGVANIIPVFNLSTYAPLWSFIPTFFALVGIWLTLINFNLIVDAPLKIVFFLLIFLGNGINVIEFANGQVLGNYLGSARLAYVTGLVILPVVIYRMVVSYLENSVAEVALAASQPSFPPKSENPSTSSPATTTATTKAVSPASSVETQSVQLLKAMGVMMEAEDANAIPNKVIHATLEMLRSDFAVLLKVQDANYADIVVGYDRVMNRPVSGISLSLDDQPTLVNAIERRAQRALFVERNTEELDDLYRRLDIDQRGAVYIQPLMRKQQLVGILVIGMPYSQRELKTSEMELLKGIGIIASNLLSLSYEAHEATLLAEERAIQAMVEGVSIDEIGEDDVIKARREMEASLQLARDQITQLSRQVMELKVQLDNERNRVLRLLGDANQDLSVSQRIRVIIDEQNDLREERDELARQLHDAETSLTTITAQDDESLAHDLSASLRREYESLVAARDRLRQQIDDLRAKDKAVIPDDVHSMLSTMSEEKSRLEFERNQLSDKLTDIQSQLNTMGVEGGVSGLAQVVAQLYAERKGLTKRLETLKSERDALLNERKRFAGNIDSAKQRDATIENLQQQIKHLAADREAFIKLRERMRSDYTDLLSKYETVREQRTSMHARLESFVKEVADARGVQGDLQQQIKQLSDEKSNLLKVRDQLTAQVESLQAENTIIDEPSEDTQNIIRDQLLSLQNMIKELTEQRERLELELNYTQTALAESKSQTEHLRLTQSQSMPDAVTPNYSLNNPDLFVGLVQELRTPMTSIAGYIDLLLGESAGILGEMQRNFLQRVSANILRLASMIDDLVKVTQLDTGNFELERDAVDLISVIEDAITDASNQFREKDLVVNLSLDDSLPALPADRDAVRQIIGQLLTNAYLVSPSGSEITISAKADSLLLPDNEDDLPSNVILIKVQDMGGGILPEDIPRVFARKYKAENPLIEGLGDTGVGMSIAKALVEAHDGYLWVESEPGVGSAFSIAIPLNIAMEIED